MLELTRYALILKALCINPSGTMTNDYDRSDRHDRNDRNDRHDRNDRNDRHDRNDRNDRHDRNDRNDRHDDMDDMMGDDRRGGFGGRRKARPPLNLEMDYKIPESLRPFITPEGKIVPSRVNRLNAQQQRILTREIKRARHLALLPYTSNNLPTDYR